MDLLNINEKDTPPRIFYYVIRLPRSKLLHDVGKVPVHDVDDEALPSLSSSFVSKRITMLMKIDDVVLLFSYCLYSISLV